MTTDLETFGLAFAAVWVTLGAYFLYLHRVEARLEREVEALKRRLR